MRKKLRPMLAILMLTSLTTSAWAEAASGCANPSDMSAIRTAAIQQQLMVAALTCQATDRYNSFVTAYRKDLQASDLALQTFFRRVHGQSGTADYHAFKTRLANASSLDSIHDVRGFCSAAQARFDAALENRKPTLAVFLAGQQVEADREFAPCPIPPRSQTVVASGGRKK